jgi:protein-L-isoaspartate(D-aspartate) O-methyltransferase
MQTLIEQIENDARETRHYTGRSTIKASVIEAMKRVDRARFVPQDAALFAWENRPLSIGYGQTISQPFIVALMTELLDLEASHRVLEIGTGSGYQAAVLAELVSRVYTVEIVPELAASASTRLAALGYDNVEVRAADGWHGWPDAAPFDRIIVTAVGEEIPPLLLQQLKSGGRMVMPIGPQHAGQNLTVIDKTADGVSQRDVLPVQFVPLTRAEPAADP